MQLPWAWCVWQRESGGGRAEDNMLLEDPHITSPDKAKGGRRSSARRTPLLWVEKTSSSQSHSSSLRPWHCHSEGDQFGELSGHSHGRHGPGGGFIQGAGGDGWETSDTEMDTAMHETGCAPRAKEVGESDQQTANSWFQPHRATGMPKHLLAGLIMTLKQSWAIFKSWYLHLGIFFLNVRFSSSLSFLNSQPRSGPGLQARVSKSQNSPENAARERSRVRNLRQAFQSLQAALPSVPPDTKLSKLDVLVLATNYIAHLTETLDHGGAMCDHAVLPRAEGYLHPVKVSFTQQWHLLSHIQKCEKIFKIRD